MTQLITGNNGPWYFAAILVLYFLYPWLHRLVYGAAQGGQNEGRLLIQTSILMVVSALVFWLVHKYDFEWWKNSEQFLARIPVFILGSWVGHLVRDKHGVSAFWPMASFVVFAVWYGFAWRYVAQAQPWWLRLAYSAGAPFIAWMLSILCAACGSGTIAQIMRKGLRSVGSYSLELYATHLLLYYGFAGLIPKAFESKALLLIYSVLAFVWAWVIKRYGEPLLLKLWHGLLKLHSSV